MGDEDAWAVFGADDGEEKEPTEEISAAEALLSQRPEENGVLAFHGGVEEALLLQVERDVEDGDAEGVLAAVDRFCYGQHWMMHCGERKGAILEATVDGALEPDRPLRVLEVGSYCGYSAVRIARHLREGDVFIGVDTEAACLGWADRMLRKAGLRHRTELVEGRVADVCDDWQEPFGLVFLDHDKASYLADLQRLEARGLLAPGCTVVADNVLCFQPLTEYLTYVRDGAGPFKESVIHTGYVEYTADAPEHADGIEVSVHR